MKKGLFVLSSMLIITACNMRAPVSGTAIDEMTSALNEGIANDKALMPHSSRGAANAVKSNAPVRALLPSLSVRTPWTRGGARRFDISVKDMPARDFYMGLVADTPVNMVVSPKITGNITLTLKNVTVTQVLQSLEDAYGYTYIPIQGGYEIVPNILKTQIFKVNYLEMQRKGSSDMTISSGEVTSASSNSGGSAGSGGGNQQSSFNSGSLNGNNQNLTNVIGKLNTKSDNDFWKSLRSTLSNIVGTEGGRTVTVNALAGIVVVHAYPKELKQVEKYLDVVQSSISRQIILEAKVLEVSLDNDFQMGIDWQVFGANLNALAKYTTQYISMDDFAFPADGFRAHISWIPKDFITVIRALETQGNVQVLSSPRVAAMNNQQAVIKVGSDEFFVTNVYQNQNIVSSGLATQPTLSVTLTPFFSGITLDVTPQIDVSGQVTLHIHPSVSLVKDQHKIIDLGSQGGVLDLPLARSTIRESDTIVHAKNGHVVVIGGLMQDTTTEGIAQLPWFGNIPFLGSLVRRTKQGSSKTELVILIKPTIVNDKSNLKDLVVSNMRVSHLKRGFHIGSRPDVFGTQGEASVPLGHVERENLNAR